jgi:hypothetical protein
VGCRVGYDTTGNLFGEPQKVSNEVFAEAFRQTLIKKAAFKQVGQPMPMKTKTNAVIYYLFFAFQKPVAANIVKDIVDKYRKRQGL